MQQTGIDTQLEPQDVKHLNRWVAEGKFVDLSDAIHAAIHAGVNWWLFEEFHKWEREKYGNMTDAEFHKAIAEEGMVPYAKPEPPPPPPPVNFVIPDEDEYIDGLDDSDGSESEWESVMQEAVRSRLRYLIQQRRWGCHKIAERLTWDGLPESDATVESWYRGRENPGDPDAVLEALNRMLEE